MRKAYVTLIYWTGRLWSDAGIAMTNAGLRLIIAARRWPVAPWFARRPNHD
jgi:hypothetical protein